MNWFTDTPWPLAVASGLYLFTAEAFRRQGQTGVAATFLFYALANVGFIVAFYQGRVH